MHTRYVDGNLENLEQFFQRFLPQGDDPKAEDLEAFYYSEHIAATTECEELGLKAFFKEEICKLAHSVFSRAQGPGRQQVAVLDTTTKKNSRARSRKHHAPSCDAAVFFVDNRFNKHVCIPRDKPLTCDGSSAMPQNGSAPTVGRPSFADIVVPVMIQVDHDSSAFEFENPEHLIARHEQDVASDALEEVEKCLATIFARQHRTHLLSFYVYRVQARIMASYRDGCVVSHPFPYTTSHKNNALHRFFWRLAHMSRKDLGYDSTVTPATSDDFANMLQFATSSPELTPYVRDQLYYALCVDPVTTPDPTPYPNSTPTSDQWPLKRVTRADGSYVLVGRSRWASPALFGRCTRGYVVYDPFKQEAYFMKDSWRFGYPESRKEHEVYERLAQAGVGGVLTCYGGEDVGEDTTHNWQQGSCADESDSSEGSHHRFVHYRIFFKEIGRPLTDFADWRELLILLTHALCAHRDAWESAGVLHHDVSVNNVLIVETLHTDSPGGPTIRRVANMCDWDLCEYKEEMEHNNDVPDQIGTWVFRSALSSSYPFKPYLPVDDVESFIHVLHTLVLRFMKTRQSRSLPLIFPMLYEECWIALDQRRGGIPVHVGGITKLDYMLSGRSPVTPMANSTIAAVLGKLAALCKGYYDSFDYPSMSRQYAPLESSNPGCFEAGAEDHAETEEAENTAYLTHDAVIAILREYGESVDHEPVSWAIQEDLVKSSDDFFRAANIAHKDNRLSFSSEPTQCTVTSPSLQIEPPRKQRKHAA